METRKVYTDRQGALPEACFPSTHQKVPQEHCGNIIREPTSPQKSSDTWRDRLPEPLTKKVDAWLSAPNHPELPTIYLEHHNPLDVKGDSGSIYTSDHEYPDRVWEASLRSAMEQPTQYTHYVAEMNSNDALNGPVTRYLRPLLIDMTRPYQGLHSMEINI